MVFIPEYLHSKKAPELTRRLHLFPAKSFSHPLRMQKYIFFHLQHKGETIYLNTETFFLIRFYNFASHKENIYTIMSTSKHPKGLYLVFATSTAERFSYYGMRAIFILFLTQALLFDKEHAASIYGSYTGLVYLTPLIGDILLINTGGSGVPFSGVP